MSVVEVLPSPLGEQLLHRWKPVFYLHSEESYFPCSIDWLIQHCGISSQQELLSIHGDVSIDASLFPGQRPLSSAPTYAIARRKGDYIYLSYGTVYAYNGEYNI